jgi:hypothetical protein
LINNLQKPIANFLKAMKKTQNNLETKIEELGKRIQNIEKLLQELIINKKEEKEDECPGPDCWEPDDIEPGADDYEKLEPNETIYCYPCHFGEENCPHCSEREPESEELELEEVEDFEPSVEEK